MGYGKKIEIEINKGKVSVRDYGRGIPLGKVIECVSKINTGGKYDSSAFQKSVGLNGVGTKAVNALAGYFKVQSVREKKTTWAEFAKGILKSQKNNQSTDIENGTLIHFVPDEEVFTDYEYKLDYVESMICIYTFLNVGLTIYLNGQPFFSDFGCDGLVK